MISRSAMRFLFVVVIAVAAWAIGFLMGGGRQSAGSGKATNFAGTGIPRPGEAARAAGHEAGAVNQIESSTLRRQPWTHDRLLAARRGVLPEGNIINAVRRSMQISDLLQAEDFPLALEVATELKDDGSDYEIFRAVAIARWAELNPAAAAEFLAKRSDKPSFFDVDGDIVWSIWASTDPTSAATRARQMPEQGDRDRALRKIIETVARRDAASALAFAKANAPELLKDGALGEALGDSAGSRSPDEAARELAGIGEARKLDDATERWARKDRSAALAWARNLQDDKVRTAAMEGAYRAWMTTAPREAAAAILGEKQSGPEFGKLANLALTHWPEADFAGALTWATQVPKGVDLSMGYGFLAERVAQKDPAAGAKWLETLPAGTARDEAVSRYANQVVSKEGSAALEWAHTIGDAAKRLETMQQLTRYWFDRQPAQAFEWLQNNALLTPEEKAQVLKK
jgi:hypothetical protein